MKGDAYAPFQLALRGQSYAAAAAANVVVPSPNRFTSTPRVFYGVFYMWSNKSPPQRHTRSS